MKIIAHRGFWKTKSEKNTKIAILRAIEAGFGIETDFRDYGQNILISHNPPIGTEIHADEVFRLYHEAGSNEPLALNIKADGLQDMMDDMLKKHNITNYFFFECFLCFLFFSFLSLAIKSVFTKDLYISTVVKKEIIIQR